MNTNDELLQRIGAVIIRSTGLCIISIIPITIIMSVLPGGDDGYTDSISNWYLWLGLISAAFEVILGLIMWKYAIKISQFMCKGL